MTTHSRPTPKGLRSRAQGCEPRATLGRPGSCASNPERVAPIDDITWERIEHTINCSIHELVYALHHIEDDQFDEAQNCLTTVGMNVDTIQEQLLKHQEAA